MRFYNLLKISNSILDMKILKIELQNINSLKSDARYHNRF